MPPVQLKALVDPTETTEKYLSKPPTHAFYESGLGPDYHAFDHEKDAPTSAPEGGQRWSSTSW